MNIKIVERLNRVKFGWAVRSIKDTPVLHEGTVEYTALSMVQHRDVLPYLLALKSLARFVPPARVVVIADPTLDADDRALMREHVPHIRIHEAAEFHRDGIPRGGTWERLHAISVQSAGSYVIQLDADTVTMRDPVAVRKAIDDNVSFTLGTEDNQVIQPAAEVAAWAQKLFGDGDHIQGQAEAALDRFDPEGVYRYVRGCSGFAGFARGSLTPEHVLEVSRRMGAIFGARWSAWGTEQVTSNLLVSTSPGARVLPHPDYCIPSRQTERTVFLHFIGFQRYRTGLYERLARQIALDLDKGQAAHAVAQ